MPPEIPQRWWVLPEADLLGLLEGVRAGGDPFWILTEYLANADDRLGCPWNWDEVDGSETSPL